MLTSVVQERRVALALVSASTCSPLAHNVSAVYSLQHRYGSCWHGGTLRDMVLSVRI